MRNSTTISTAPRQGRYALLLLCAGLAILFALALKPAESSAANRVVADVGPDAAQLELSVRAPRSSRAVTFFVDGDKRWTDRSPKWRFGLSANNLQPGRHRMTTEVVSRDGDVKRASRVAFLETDAGGSHWRLRPRNVPGAEPSVSQAPLVEAGFDSGWDGWNMGGVGDVEPTIATDDVRSGSGAGKFVLKGTQDRSELILDGTGSAAGPGTIEFREGDEGYYGFSFLVKSMQYGGPGAHNLITQFKSDGDESPQFGLQLWDFEGEKGLWSHGEAMDGDHFLAPVAHDQWHDVVIHFKASETGRGFYEIFFNGQLVDSGDDVTTVVPNRDFAYLKTGLYRNGGEIPGTSEMRIDSARLGTSMAQVTG